MLVAAYTVVPTAGQIALYLLIVFGAPIAVLVGSSRNARRTRRPWQLIAAGLAVFGAIETIFDPHHVSPFGQSALVRLLYVVGCALLIAGLVLPLRAGHDGWEPFVLVEVGITAVALVLVQLVAFIAFNTSSAVGLTADFATTLSFALAGGILLASAEHIVVDSTRRTPASLAILAAVVALLVGGEAYALAAPRTYGLDSWPNVAWLVAYLLFATAALVPSPPELSAPPRSAPGMPIARLSSLGLALL
ncbi:MAG TPA: hypothetical protein VJ986_04705, partial [Gaiellaceae bacterium]|nr:hypothetical protein [Gaiellaceae bacterium]